MGEIWFFMTRTFETYIETDVLAGLSAVLLYWFAIATVVMGLLCRKQKYRFLHWFEVSARERADACLNLGWFAVLANSTWHRAIATYSFAVQEWHMTPATLYSAPFYLPLAMVGISMVLWWVCFEFFGTRRRWWWCMWMWTGLVLFFATVWIF
jgi:hypothetical protein